MEHLAEGMSAGADQGALMRAIMRHIKDCPDCQEHHLRRLAQLEDTANREDQAAGKQY